MTALQTPTRPRQDSAPAVVAPGGARGLIARVDALQDGAVELVRRFAPLALRVALATTFIWFGALKVAGVPTLPAGLIAAILPVGNLALIIPAMGVAEVALGAWLLVGWRLPLAALAMAGHLAGTFLVPVLRPDVAFQGGNPLLLTIEGEFVLKNIVLLAGALMLAAYAPTRARIAAAAQRG